MSVAKEFDFFFVILCVLQKNKIAVPLCRIKSEVLIFVQVLQFTKHSSMRYDPSNALSSFPSRSLRAFRPESKLVSFRGKYKCRIKVYN